MTVGAPACQANPNGQTPLLKLLPETCSADWLLNLLSSRLLCVAWRCCWQAVAAAGIQDSNSSVAHLAGSCSTAQGSTLLQRAQLALLFRRTRSSMLVGACMACSTTTA
jgi:hypothetical protein